MMEKDMEKTMEHEVETGLVKVCHKILALKRSL